MKADSDTAAFTDLVVKAVRRVDLDGEFLWSAIRLKTEDRFREKLAFTLDHELPPDIFVAPSVRVGNGKRADIAIQQDGSPVMAIEMKQVWGSDPRWHVDGNTRRAVNEFADAESPLHAVMMYEADRVRACAPQGVVFLLVVHVHTQTSGAWRAQRGLSSEARHSAAPDEVDSTLLRQLATIGRPYGPTVLADHVRDVKTAVEFSIHGVLASVRA